MIINFIRHGMTEGNKSKKYIGITDEVLCDEGIHELKKIKYPDCSILVSSPMKRCKQTAEIIYPGKNYRICEEFRECSFGIFEGKNYTELSDTPEYQKWIESNGKDRFPGGDDPFEFRRICTEGFIKLIDSCQDDEVISLVVHGGVIMSVMETLAFPGKDFYEWHVSNGHGYVTRFYKGKFADKNKKNCHLTVISMI